MDLRGIYPNEWHLFAICEERRIAVDDPFEPGGLGIGSLRKQWTEDE